MDNREKIRIFVDAHTFDNEFQGSRTYINEMYILLAQREALQLYIGAYDIAKLAKYFPGVNTIHFVKFKSRSAFTRLLFDIPAIIKKYRIQYAHFNYIVPLFKNCKYIVTIHDVIFKEYPQEFSFGYRVSKKLLYKRAAVKADILTTNSLYSKRSIQKYLGIREEKINIISNAVNDRYFGSHDKTAVRKTFQARYGFDKFILYVSRIEPRKNHALLLQTYLDLKLHLQGYHLVLVGHESIKTPAFAKIIDHLPANIKPFLFIRTDVPEDELLLFYRAATVFVYPSKAEGFGIPPLEAAATKTPVLCSNTSAMGEFDFFGNNHVDPADTVLFKTRLSALLTTQLDDQLLNSLAEVIHQRYSWKESADKLYALIEKDHYK